MPIERVSTYGVHQSTLGYASRVMANLADLQRQLSSGLKSDNFAGLASQTEQFLALDARMIRSKAYTTNNILAETRLESTAGALDEIVTIATDLKNLLLLRRSTTTEQNLAYDQQIQGLWQSMAGQLNTSVNGRYLFSGTRTETPTVDPEDYPTLVQPGVPDNSYYQGDHGDIILQADDTTTLLYNVRGDAEGFQKIMAAFAIGRSAGASDNDTEIQKAFDLAAAGLQDVIALQANVNANKVAINQANDRQASMQLYWKGVKESIANTDLVSVSSQVAVDQGVLQASFQAFASINNLRLVNFLK